MDSTIYRVMNFCHAHNLRLQTGALAMAAEELGVPWCHAEGRWHIRIGESGESVGFRSLKTSATSKKALALCWNKRSTARALRKWKIPTPRHRVVQSLESALAAARRFHYPVVVKPVCGGGGDGVTVGVKTPEGLRAAFKKARRYHRKVIVERYVEGNDYRLFVVGNRLIAAAHRMPASVVGDGRSSIKKLISIANRDPRRSDGTRNILSTIPINSDVRRMLRLQGYTLKSVPVDGQKIVLRSVANVCAGGTSIDVTDLVHPHNRILATRVAKKLGLRMAGIDFICKDISRSYRDHGGVVIEVNRCPDIRVHLTPREGRVQDVARAVVLSHFPQIEPESPSPTNSVAETDERRIRLAVFDDLGSPRSSLDFQCFFMPDDPEFTLTLVSAKEIAAGRLGDFDVLIQGGGRPGTQAQKLGSEGLQAIRDFVMHGGGYVGICAGARLATSDREEFLNILNACVVDGKHWARGTGFVRMNLTPAGKEQLNETRDTVRVWYHQGALLAPGNHPELPAYTELATYATEIAKKGAPRGVMIGTTAIASSSYGKGRVLAISPHPEQTRGCERFVRAGLRWCAGRSDAVADQEVPSHLDEAGKGYG